MDPKTKQAIDYFVEFTPEYIDEPIHCTDRQRVFNIAIAAFHAHDPLSDVNEELSRLIQEKRFMHAEKVANSVKHDVGLLVEFLNYQQKQQQL